MLADEPQPGALRQLALKQRPSVHVPQRARALVTQFVPELRKLLQTLAQDIMVITVTRVAGDETGSRDGIAVTGLKCDNTPGARQHLQWIDALRRVALQVGHFTVPAFGQPLGEARGELGGISGGDAAVVEAQFARLLPEDFLHRGADCAM